MAAILTDWEKQHIESIQLLLQKATEELKDFEEKEKRISSAESDLADYSQDWLKFRHFVLDLYSVLDYVWYLLYCHFSNGGNVDFTRKGRMLGFPSKPSGIKVSAHHAQDQKSKFVNDWLKQISKDTFGEGSHLYRIVSDCVLEVQPKIPVDASGHGPNTPACPTLGSDEESFLLLHFYRNCAAHRDLVRFAPSKSYAEINQKTREIKLVTEIEERDGYHYHPMQRGYWIQLPEIIGQGEPRLLLDTLKQMNCFVRKTTITLLKAALLVTPAHESLQKLATDYPTHAPILPSPKKVKNPPDKNKKMVLNEYKQKLGLDELKVTLNPEAKAHPDKNQFFIASYKLVVSTQDGQKIVEFDSGECTEKGIDKSLTKAAEKILEDLFRLGLVISE